MNKTLINSTSVHITNALPLSFYLSLIVSIFGVVTNLLNIFVFLSNRANMKHQIFTFMLAISSVDLAYCALLTYKSWSTCEICQLYTVYFTQLYTIIVFDYITSCLAIFNILIDIIVSFERYLIVVNSRYLRRISTQAVIWFVGVFSLLYYSPVLFMKSIEAIENSSESFRLVLTSFGKSILAKIVLIVLQSVRIFLSVLLLPTINILTAVQLKRVVKVRSTLTGQRG